MTAKRVRVLATAVLLASVAAGRCQPSPIPGPETEQRQGDVGLTTEELTAFLAKVKAG